MWRTTACSCAWSGGRSSRKKGVDAAATAASGSPCARLFKYVATGTRPIRAEQSGKAAFEFELPDNLTGWRVLAMAVTPTTGSGSARAASRATSRRRSAR